MQQTTVDTFDYSTLDTETRVIVQQRTSELKALVRKTAQDIIEIGQKLYEVREALCYKRPGFQAWCKAEEWSHGTAYRLINAYRFAQQNRTNLVHISPSIFYLISAPQTPVEAQADIIDAAPEITVAAAQETITAQKLASAALNNPNPPTVAINAAQEVLDEATASGYVTLKSGKQVPANDGPKLLQATRAATSERAARQHQHVEERKSTKPVLLDAYLCDEPEGEPPYYYLTLRIPPDKAETLIQLFNTGALFRGQAVSIVYEVTNGKA